jgi:ketosteroid isomerase-like protein
MDYAEELQAIIRKLPAIYRSGDIDSYLEHYAPDISAYYSGTAMTAIEAHQFIKSLFEGGGKTVKFEMTSPLVQFDESTEAAIVSYRWREHFRFNDGHETDTEYYESDVWYRRDGKWKIVNVHQSTIKEYPVS